MGERPTSVLGEGIPDRTCPHWTVITSDYVVSGDGDPAEPVSLMCNLMPGHDGSHFDSESEMEWLPRPEAESFSYEIPGPGPTSERVVAEFVTHHPSGDCTCEAGGRDACEYRMLADAVDTAFSPPDQDAAEVSIHIEAVQRAAAYIVSQPCTCNPAAIADQEPCPRCAAIGRLGDEVQFR